MIFSFSRAAKACAIAGLFLSGSSSAAPSSPTIAIIGAGIAGLTCAYRLQQKGFNAQVYEARSRVGGRIFTATISGSVAEFGGQNLADGGDAANVRTLCKELGLSIIEYVRYGEAAYGQESTPQPSAPALPQVERAALEKIAHNAHTMQDVLDQLLDRSDPLYKRLALTLNGYEGGSPEKLSPLYTDTLYYLLLGGVCEAHQNAQAYEVANVDGGTGRLPESLAHKLGDSIHTNMALSRVDKNTTAQGERKYLLTFANGQQTSADILILALPCPPYARIEFAPDVIPQEKLSAIKNVQYGQAAKILVPIHSATANRGLHALGDDVIYFFNDDGNIINLFFAESGAAIASPAIATQFYHREVASLEKTYGWQAPQQVVQTLARDESFASYDGPVAHSWPNDPFAGGTYSFIAAGQENILATFSFYQGERIRSLFEPIHGTLYFAGEHTAIHEEIAGTIEAACESGERTARMILKSLGK